jgi:hypothetical protein
VIEEKKETKVCAVEAAGTFKKKKTLVQEDDLGFCFD